MGLLQMAIIVCISGFTGWLISWLSLRLLFISIFKKKRPGGYSALSFLQKEFENSTLIDEKIADPVLFERLKPEIESHVDYFLNEKLATVFPLLYKFMGEKTLAQFKAAFMTEIDLLFPVIIKSYAGSLKKEIRLDIAINERLNVISGQKLKAFFFEHAKKEIARFMILCIVTGLLSGLLTVLIIYLSGQIA